MGGWYKGGGGGWNGNNQNNRQDRGQQQQSPGWGKGVGKPWQNGGDGGKAGGLSVSAALARLSQEVRERAEL